MDTAFEYIFYSGLVALAVGLLWFLVRLIRGPRNRIALPILLAILGVGLMVTPGVITKNIPVDLGARKTSVEGEIHLGLTGWDGESYAFLALETEAVVVQMANADVTDETLQYLKGMTKLRELDLNDSNITDSGLTALAELKSLERLRLRGTRITDTGFKDHLMPLEKLRQIVLKGTAVTPETIAEWKAAGKGRRAM